MLFCEIGVENICISEEYIKEGNYIRLRRDGDMKEDPISGNGRRPDFGRWQGWFVRTARR